MTKRWSERERDEVSEKQRDGVNVRDKVRVRER